MLTPHPQILPRDPADRSVAPWAYLRDLSCLSCPGWPINKVLELAPARWTTTRQDPQLQQQLDANIFRGATLLPNALHAAV